MKRLLICGGLGLFLYSPTQTTAQSSIPSKIYHKQTRLAPAMISENFLEIQSLVFPLRLFLSDEQRAYVKTFSRYLDRGRVISPKDYLGIDRNRFELLLSISHYERGESEQALALLRSIDPATLYRYEAEQHNLLLSYLMLQSESDDARVGAQLQKLLLSDTRYGEQARLLHAYLAWKNAGAATAQKLLEGSQWTDELYPEVEYLGALLSFDLTKPELAIANANQLVGSHPSFSDRVALASRLSHAHSRLGNYDKAIDILQRLDKSKFTPSEYYLLGHALYASNRYTEAISSLQQASQYERSYKPLAQFALGNIYQYQGAYSEAQLAFDAVTKSAADASIKEQALYRSIELAHANGGAVFGARMGVIEDFLRNYPRSLHRPRVEELLRGYISASTDYASALRLIDRLEGSGLKLQDLKQIIYLKQALKAQEQSDQESLARAIRLGDISQAYSIAAVYRAELALKQRSYSQAMHDARLALSSSFADNTTKSKANYLIGYASFNQKSYSEAQTAFSRVLELSSTQEGVQTDAALRLGDIAQSKGDNEQALRYYGQANQLSSHLGNEEALYRTEQIFGRQGRYKEQIKSIEETLSRFPNSVYTPELLLDRGRAERLLGQTTLAIQSYTSIHEAYPASPVTPKALLEKALLLGNLDRDQEAIETYKSLINSYPNSLEASTALADLRSIYSEQDKLDEYLSYARSLSGGLRPDDTDIAHIAYLAIDAKSRKGLSGLSSEIEAYMKKYPKTSDTSKAERLLAKAYLAEGRDNDAISLLRRSIANSPIGEHKLETQLELATLHQKLGHKAEAYRVYTEAYAQSAGTKRYSLISGIGVLRTANASERKTVLSVSESLLSRTDLGEEQREEILLLRGKAEEQGLAYKAAIKAYESVGFKPNSVFGAEAIVRRASLLQQSKDFKGSQKLLDQFIGSGSKQDYWLARAIICLSDNYMLQGEQYLAKQYLESLKDNYTGDEHDIKQMIEQRLSKHSK